jgi:Arc/MetJ-type ribon-helix-helix transcriptional regulator
MEMTEPKYIRVVDGIPCITLTEHEHIANKLRELLAEAYADADEVLRPYVKRLEEQLTESQAREAKLRDALTKIANNTIHWYSSIQDAKEALALPTNDTALQDFLEDEHQNPWKAVLIDEIVCIGIYTKEHDKNPKKALHEVILWNQAVAIDPAVSTDAATLIKQSKREVLLEAAEAMESGAFETPYGLRRMAEELKCTSTP